MVGSITKENYFWHKLHSLSGIVPIGFYVLQHLVLNSFSLVSAERYNSVSDFFYSLPSGILFVLEFGVVLLPLVFHAVYGLFIIKRAEPNYLSSDYKYTENRMYWFQRVSGLYLFVFIIFHIATTTLKVKYFGDHRVVDYAHMQDELFRFGGLVFLIYLLGVLCASYHLSYGIWNFCIRWGLTISESAQKKVRLVSTGLFVAVTLLGWAALVGFKLHNPRLSQLQVLDQQPLVERSL